MHGLDSYMTGSSVTGVHEDTIQRSYGHAPATNEPYRREGNSIARQQGLKE
jgi:hypothetical protein